MALPDADASIATLAIDAPHRRQWRAGKAMRERNVMARSKPLAFENLKRGGAMRRINNAIKDAVQNCLDPATPLKATRQVTLTLTLAPIDGTRERPFVQPSITAKLSEAAIEPELVQVHLIRKEAFVEEAEDRTLFEISPLPLAAGEVPKFKDLNEGSVLAEVNYALMKAVENLADPDTAAKGDRVVSCVLKFTNESKTDKRGPLKCQPVVNTKLQPRAIAPVMLKMSPVVVSEADFPVAYDESVTVEAINV